MSEFAQARKARRRRAERIWAVLVCGGLGGCLALVVAMQITATGSGTRGSIQTGSASRGAPQAYTVNDDDDIRTGSILIAPTHGEKCQHSLFDNYTGQIWPVGTVSCEAALTKSNEKHMSSPERLEMIGNAFRPPR